MDTISCSFVPKRKQEGDMWCYACGDRCEEGVCRDCGALHPTYAPKKMDMSMVRRPRYLADRDDPLFHPEDERYFADGRISASARTQTHLDPTKYDSGLD